MTLFLALRPSVGMAAASFAHLSRYVVIDGVPSSPLRTLAPGESETVRLSVCLLAEGRYEFGCTVEELRDPFATDDGTLELEPRRYEAREPLVINVTR